MDGSIGRWIGRGIDIFWIAKRTARWINRWMYG